MADEATAQIEPVDLGPIPPSKVGRPPSIPVEKIHLALLAAKGNRTEAAESLGIKVKKLKERINDNPELKSRWNAKAVKIRQTALVDKLTAEGEPTVNRFDIAANQMEELLVGQNTIAQLSLTRLQKVQDRIARGEKARELAVATEISDVDKVYIAKNGLSFDEEKLLLNQEIALMQEYARANETCANVNYRQAQMRAIPRRKGDEGRGKRALGVPNKGAPPQQAVQVNATNAIINAPSLPVSPLNDPSN